MKQTLNVKAMGLAAGFWWGVGCFLLALAALYGNGWGQGLVDAIGSFYIGYAATWGGAVTGLIWGFIDGFICGSIFSWLYNYFNK